MQPELDDLIHRFLDESLDSAGQATLNQLLREDPVAAGRFADIALFHDTLRSGFRSGALPSRHTHATIAGPDRKPSTSLHLKAAVPWLLAMAAAMMVAFIWKPKPTPASGTARIGEVRDQGFAVLSHGVDPVWTDKVPAEGEFLTAGKLELESGLVQIEFLTGVLVVIEGETTIEIVSANEMHLLQGKLRAHVPAPAIGFQIHTPQGTVVDLGTEFALNLNNDSAELHVIDGEVEWHGRSQPEILLTTGKGLLFSENTARAIHANPDLFTGPSKLSRMVTKRQNERFGQWLVHSRALANHPDLLAYFPLESIEPGTRELRVRQGGSLSGAIVGAKMVAGRWPGKKALDFSPNGSRVRTYIPGKHTGITYSVWAKIDSLDRQYNALFLTDNYGYGKPHWQLLEDGRLFFSVGIGKGKFHHIFHSPAVWNHSKTEQWLHLVTTYDVATRTCVHYLNGGEISRETAPPEKGVDTLTIGHSQIGNWGLPTRDDPSFAVRNLNGRMDEFAVFKSVLSPQEVKELYENGKP